MTARIFPVVLSLALCITVPGTVAQTTVRIKARITPLGPGKILQLAPRPGLKLSLPAPAYIPSLAPPKAPAPATPQAATPVFFEAEKVFDRLAAAPAIQGIVRPQGRDQEQNLDKAYDNAGRPTDAEPVVAGQTESAAPRTAGLEKSGPELWALLQNRIAQDLPFALKSRKPEQWASQTAAWLRNYPAARLETAMAEALAKVHQLGTDAVGLIEARLSNSLIDDLPGVKVYSLTQTRYGTYAFTDKGLFCRQGDGWDLLLKDASFITGYHEFDGNLYVYAKKGTIYEIHGAKTTPIVKREFLGSFGEPTIFNGKVHLPTSAGIFRKDGHNQWEQLLDIKAAWSTAQLGETLFAGTNDTVLRKSETQTQWEPVLRDLTATNMVDFLGKLYIFGFNHANDRYELYEVDENGATRPADLPIDEDIHGLVQAGKSLYLLIGKNLYMRERDGWTLLVEETPQVADYIEGSDIYIRATAQGKHGIFRCSGGECVWIHDDAGGVSGVIKYADKSYFGTSNGLYEARGKAWKSLYQGPVSGVVETGNNIYIGTESGIKRFSPAKALPKGWKLRILDDIAARVEQAVEAPSAAASSAGEPFSSAEDGSIVDDGGRTIFSGLAQAARSAARMLGARLPAEPEESEKQDINSLPLDAQIDALMDKYGVPEGDRAMRKRLTMQVVTRVRTDIHLFAHADDVRVDFGQWWTTDQNDPSLKTIFIPLEDIFVRAVDDTGAMEAVGAAMHEVAHYFITRPDLAHPLAPKYLLTSSPEANNLLYQHLEDIRVNTWLLLAQPGLAPYFDAIYEQMWPENIEDARRTRQARESLLARSILRIKPRGEAERDWMPPHQQFANAIIYHWRHPEAEPDFLTDPMAKDYFHKTLDAIEEVRRTHPSSVGGRLLEAMTSKAAHEALEIMDREIFPYYAQLIKKSKDDLDEMKKAGSQVKKNPGHCPNQPSQGGNSKDTASGQGSPQGDEIDQMDKDLAEAMRSQGDKKRGTVPQGKKPASKTKGKPGAKEGEGNKKNAWRERRDKIIQNEKKIRQGMTSYEKYKLRAEELGLIGKVDGIVKRLLLPTKHARLSRQFYYEGDEPDMNKYYDDMAQGHYDTPIMRRWSRKIRRSAKISLVLDISGSMGSLTEAMNSPLDSALLGIVSWIEVCQRNGLDFEVILFDEKQTIAHPFGKTVKRDSKQDIVRQIIAAKGGSTAIGAAFKLALDRIIKQPATHRFVIFATDEGQNTGESPEAWKTLAAKNKIVTMAMVMGTQPADYEKHFDYAVRVPQAKDFPALLLGVLQKAIRAVMGPLGFLR
ncbi:MAG TPA: hypothetical protein DEB40_06970 [Elusimicrobia bacterium]|nr:hypothetical protein [Elusimicrobiota bacterium]HBT61469.1 hypothetical protein [Elusimicrobiota bacterium]